jgi:hypothetical protein
MKKRRTAFITIAMVAMASSVPAASPGRFTYAGPTSAEADVVSIKWRFGFQFSVNLESISEVSFSCGSIKESAVKVSGSSLKPDARGLVIVETAATPVSEQTTPWLFSSSTTKSTCMAVATVEGGKKLKESAPVTFAPVVKVALLSELREAHEYNKQRAKPK